jgi:16S rRNA (adenine1518-N6/adenine1519-N6)-dimethyltransferase
MSGIAAKKSLGQHFLHDRNVLARIAELARPRAGSGVVEIGPGTGNLTEFLLGVLPPGVPLRAVERDPRMVPHLQERFGERVIVTLGDAADADWRTLLADPRLGPAPVVVGNLPYYAALPILFAVLGLDDPDRTWRRPRCVAMVQLEVAERVVAKPGTPGRGQVSVKLQMAADVRMALRVKPGAFVPPPKVASAMVVIDPLPALRHQVPDLARFSRLVTAGFAHRRKTLANALRLHHLPAAEVAAALGHADLPDKVRAEALGLPQWAALATGLDGAIARLPGQPLPKDPPPA